MSPEQFELYYILRNQELPFEERHHASQQIIRELTANKIGEGDMPYYYKSMVGFWRSLGTSKSDRDNEQLFDVRKKLANACLRLSLRLPNGSRFFRYFPRVKHAEGIDDRALNKRRSGALKTVYGTSLYEFHWEYPIEGFGVRKDRISVIAEDHRKIPMLDWCKQNDIIVYCNRCGLDITYEVSKDCPFMKQRYTK